jgi:amidohydrolase
VCICVAEENMSLRSEIEERIEDLRSLRRQLHAAPELSMQETKTAEFVAQRLRDIGVDKVDLGVGHPTAIVGLIHGAKPGPCIALRADMDALPIQEDAKVSYASKNKGVMHACGHDG